MKKELATNTTLSHYRTVEKIGAGGMGEVYLALDTKPDRKVDLKVLPADVAEGEPSVPEQIRSVTENIRHEERFKSLIMEAQRTL
jgi:serine/threonine protein kinase